MVVIGASAGGVEAIAALVANIPGDVNAAFFVVLHLPHNSVSYMPQILNRAGTLRAVHPKGEVPIERGMIYLAPPDKHLLVGRGRVRVVSGPRENGHRPAVDPLFRSAAQAYGGDVIGVILSGNLDDGTSGLAAVKARGGIAIVQDPDETVFRGMPSSAIANVSIDHVLCLEEMAQTIVKLIDEDRPAKGDSMSNQDDDVLNIEVRAAELDPALAGSDGPPGVPSGYSCPECNGGLFEVQDGNLVRYRCWVGHAYSAESLLFAAGSAVEAALWAALRSLEENAAFSRRLARHAGGLHHDGAVQRFMGQAKRATEHALTLRGILSSGSLHAEPDAGTLVAPES